MLNNASSIVDVLRWRAEHQPHETAFVFLGDGETESERWTYHELDAKARDIAERLRATSAAGDRVLLIYPPGLDFVAALLGCFVAGVTAVPAIPDPSPRAMARFRKIVADAQSTLAISTESLLEIVQYSLADMPELQALQWVATDSLAQEASSNWACMPPVADDLAFIQYTSGSTSAPKGVAVSHGNLIYNQRMLQAGLQSSEETTIVSWLPVYHDLGLIAQLLHALYVGSNCVLMSPVAFLQRPARWLQAISRYRGVFSAAPNFGYELCLRKISTEDCRSLDLSSWSLAMNAAEPVRHSTISGFAERFGRYGFSPRAFFPGYGLAEATICVSGGPCGQGAVVLAVSPEALAQHRVEIAPATMEDAQLIVASGSSQLEEVIEIVDPETLRPAAENRVGEIWVRGPNIARGYWAQPEATANVFEAFLAGTNDGPYLRTGDLGFLRNGQLFVTGRIKDLILIRGRNHYPQDIELTVEASHADFRPGCNGAFSCEIENEERLVVIQEVRDNIAADLGAVASLVRLAIKKAHGIDPWAIALVQSHAVIKTSSGKVARRACRDAYAQGELATLFEWNDVQPRRRAIDGITPRRRQLGNAQPIPAPLGEERIVKGRIHRRVVRRVIRSNWRRLGHFLFDHFADSRRNLSDFLFLDVTHGANRDLADFLLFHIADGLDRNLAHLALFDVSHGLHGDLVHAHFVFVADRLHWRPHGDSPRNVRRDRHTCPLAKADIIGLVSRHRHIRRHELLAIRRFVNRPTDDVPLFPLRRLVNRLLHNVCLLALGRFDDRLQHRVCLLSLRSFDHRAHHGVAFFAVFHSPDRLLHRVALGFLARRARNEEQRQREQRHKWQRRQQAFHGDSSCFARG
jgi:acyl-CoA synthetase (AMP-forming)/AMP-acid ligase II